MTNNIIRCFIAIPLPEDLLESIGQYQQKLGQITRDVRWVKPAGIHITLKFLGEQDPSIVTSVENELVNIEGLVNPFTLLVSGAGCFPNPKRPRIFWLGLEHDVDNSLFKLHDWIDRNLEQYGFEREKRRFSPHLTIGRVKNPAGFEDIFDFFHTHPFKQHKLSVKQIVFIRSILKPDRAVYTPIRKYSL